MSVIGTQGDNTDPGIGRLTRVALREVWAHEAYDFTTWLERNMDVLSVETGIQFDNVILCNEIHIE